jgi:hypothetical protein
VSGAGPPGVGERRTIPAAVRGALPNFFLAGVAKAGTTALHAYLQQHPRIFMSPIKEPWFFGVADLLAPPYGDDVRTALEYDRAWLQPYLRGPQPPETWRYVMEWDDYTRLFRDVRDETVIGEASTGYFWLPSAATAIRAKVPDARFAFTLRDPAERLFTLYLLTLWRDPRITFRAWFEATLKTPHLWPSIVGAGRYATHLQRFIDLFPREHLRIHLYDDYRADPRAVLRDLFGFLGVDPDQLIDFSRRHNETMVPRFPRLHELRRRLFGHAPPARWGLPAPRRWLPEAARRAIGTLYQSRGTARTMEAPDRRMVIDYYRDEILRTAELLGRNLSAWLR